MKNNNNFPHKNINKPRRVCGRKIANEFGNMQHFFSLTPKAEDETRKYLRNSLSSFRSPRLK